ncbi:MAG TPA: hypothetical protein VFV94_05670 [Polyangiaceae bacterium]|jgi:hypothetical protein|nr:hypothetical protein [Polyangiaceae bacterium]
MSLTFRMRADFARAMNRCPHVFLAVFSCALVAGCQSNQAKVQSVATDAGGGFMKGEPPMCFQYRGEARPTNNANNIWVHINNTCRYLVDCAVWDDVTEQQHRMVTPEYQTRSFMVAPEVPQRRVDLKLDCTWKP